MRFLPRVTAATLVVGALLVTSACSADAAAKKKKSAKSSPVAVTIKPIAGTPNVVTAQPSISVAGKKCEVKVMPLGDSLTAFAESYRGPLFRMLQADGYKNVDFVGSSSWAPSGGGDPDQEGHGGYRIGPDDSKDFEGKPANIDAHLSDWINAAKPDVILLTIGTNDLSAGGEITAQAPAKLKGLVNRIQNEWPKIRVVVGDVPPSGAFIDGVSPQKAINDMARTLADGNRTTYSENYKRLLDLGFAKDVHTLDGAHFNVAGGELFAKAWYPAARAAIDATCAG